MFKKIKSKYLLIAILIILLFSTANYIYALEVDLGLGDTPDLPKYISFIFSWAISVAGVLALISFTIGAVGLINPNLEAHKDAKSRMISAIIGLVLTMSSVLIINTINPKLISPTLTPLKVTTGIFLVKREEKMLCPQSSDVSTLPTGFKTIKYVCPGGKGSALIVSKFSKSGLESGGSDLTAVENTRVVCGGSTDVGSGSFKWAFEVSGIYYCLGGCSGNECKGVMSDTNTNIQNNINSTFAGKIKAVKIINEPTKSLYYGVIFHQKSGLESGGGCTPPIINLTDNTTCKTIPTLSLPLAANIFAINKTPLTSGDGVDFFSEEYGEKVGAKAGFYSVLSSDIKFDINKINPSTMFYKWTNIDQPNTYKNTNRTFQIKPGSINIKGNYLVGLYSSAAGLEYCQTFQGNQIVVNMQSQPFIASGGKTIKDIYIIPIN